jgi:hypothetical protein
VLLALRCLVREEREMKDQEERGRERDWWQLDGGCKRDRKNIGTSGGWLGGKREERCWKLR